MGLNIETIVPSPIRLPARDRRMLLCLFPQPKLRVSLIFNGPAWKMRDGLLIQADATIQLFYAADGTIS